MKTKRIEIPQKAIDYVFEEYPIFLEYTLEDFIWDDELEAQEINMNPYSLTFFIKSLFCKNSNAIYLSSFINFFEDLSFSTLENPHRYSTCSHAVTLYILKMLERTGAVKIIEYNVVSASQGVDIYQLINTNKKSKLKMYNILFYKLRSLRKEDIAIIERIERTLHIAKRQIRFGMHDSVLCTKLGRLEILKCIFTGHSFSQFRKNITYWKEDEGFEEDLTNVICSLKQPSKRAIK